MGLAKGELGRREYLYDFSVLGGATSGAKTLVVQDFAGTLLVEGFVITGLEVDIITPFAGTATPTVTLGNTTDPDGYLVDFYASTAAVGVIRSGEFAGALLWDDTNDHEINYRIPSTAADQNVILTIGTQALTAGKARFTFVGYRQKA